MLAARLVAAILFAGSALNPAEPADGLTVYKSGDYERAIPLLQAAASKTPNDPLIRAALLSSLVYQGRVDEAADAAAGDERDFPKSPEVIAARGEFAFYMGDVYTAEKLFNTAIKMKPETPRAVFGLYRLYRAASMYRTARMRCLLAHQIDPDDALITRAFIRYLTPEKRNEMFDAFAESHPWFYQHLERDRETDVEVKHEVSGRRFFELVGERKEITVPLTPLLPTPNHETGFLVALRLENGHTLRMQLDTGASGILVRQNAVDKAELAHLGSSEEWGIGDAGTRKTFMAIAGTCEIGGLTFKTCPIEATEGKKRVAGDEDGLLGTDIFSGYLVEIDFQKSKLHLIPQPPREPNAQGYDREIPPEEKGFTPVYRFGHQLMVPTALNAKIPGLFLIDTGATMSTVDPTFARLATKIHGDAFTRVRGVSGEVKNVFQVDDAIIQFGGFRQRNIGLMSFNLNNSPEHEEVRMDGILGFAVLRMFRLTLDYRNGLVNFEYVTK